MKENRKTEKSGFSKGKTIFFIVLALVILVLCFFGYQIGRDIFRSEAKTNTEHRYSYTLEVSKGESAFSVGAKLKSNRMIDSSLVFFLQSKLYRCKIKEGTYTVYSDMSSREILKYLNREYEKWKLENGK